MNKKLNLQFHGSALQKHTCVGWCTLQNKRFKNYVIYNRRTLKRLVLVMCFRPRLCLLEPELISMIGFKLIFSMKFERTRLANLRIFNVCSVEYKWISVMNVSICFSFEIPSSVRTDVQLLPWLLKVWSELCLNMFRFAHFHSSEKARLSSLTDFCCAFILKFTQEL